MPRELRFPLYGALALTLVLEALLVAAILFWPDFEEHIDALQDMAPMQMLKDILAGIADSGVVAYVNGQHFFKACNTVGALAAVVFGMGAVAGEAQRGTLEMWLARPISRRRMLLERWAAGALAVVFPIFATSATVPWLITYVEEEMQLGPLMLCSVQQSFLLLAIYSVTFLYSCLSSRPIQVAFVMLLFTIFEFSLYMVQTATHWSIFRLTDVEVFGRIGAAQALDWRLAVPLCAFTLVCVALSVAAFERRTP